MKLHTYKITSIVYIQHTDEVSTSDKRKFLFIARQSKVNKLTCELTKKRHTQTQNQFNLKLI